jgi:hypothetical protein
MKNESFVDMVASPVFESGAVRGKDIQMPVGWALSLS